MRAPRPRSPPPTRGPHNHNLHRARSRSSSANLTDSTASRPTPRTRALRPRSLPRSAVPRTRSPRETRAGFASPAAPSATTAIAAEPRPQPARVLRPPRAASRPCPLPAAMPPLPVAPPRQAGRARRARRRPVRRSERRRPFSATQNPTRYLRVARAGRRPIFGRETAFWTLDRVFALSEESGDLGFSKSQGFAPPQRRPEIAPRRARTRFRGQNREILRTNADAARHGRPANSRQAADKSPVPSGGRASSAPASARARMPPRPAPPHYPPLSAPRAALTCKQLSIPSLPLAHLAARSGARRQPGISPAPATRPQACRCVNRSAARQPRPPTVSPSLAARARRAALRCSPSRRPRPAARSAPRPASRRSPCRSARSSPMSRRQQPPRIPQPPHPVPAHIPPQRASPAHPAAHQPTVRISPQSPPPLRPPRTPQPERCARTGRRTACAPDPPPRLPARAQPRFRIFPIPH